MANFDLLITNGRIFDPTGATPRPGSVAIQGDRIAALGELPADASAATVVDARGGLICPGFIDIHTHSDLSALTHPCCESKVHQGVTTEVIGNCSFSAFPINPQYKPDHRDLLQMIGRADLPLDWSDLNGFGKTVERAAPTINVAPLVGHGTLRIAAGVGSSTTYSTEQRARMSGLLRECFEQGAFGFTTGLSYVPSGLASREEINDLVSLTTSYDRLYATHARSGGSTTELEAIKEAADTARETGTRLQYSHLAINQPSNWGKAAEVLERFHRLKKEDVDVAFDVYPYDASSSALTQHLPTWVQEGGVEPMRTRLADPATRKKVVQDLRIGWWGGVEGPWKWDRFILSAAPGAPELIGRSIAELAQDAGISGEEMGIRLCEQFGNEVHIVLHYREERDVISFLQDDLAVIGSDGLAMPAKDDGSRPHPRSYGCFPRVLGRFVRDLSVLTLYDAIRKMTAAPADRLRLRDRGRLQEGYFADVVVIDTERVTDRATFVNPFVLADGVQSVIVNGQLVLHGGQPTGIRSGRLLRYNA